MTAQVQIPHGTVSGYNIHHCHCEACRSARRAYDRKLYSEARKSVPHGTNKRYTVGRCRCDRCRAAHREANHRSRGVSQARIDLILSAMRPEWMSTKAIAERAGLDVRSMTRALGIAHREGSIQRRRVRLEQGTGYEWRLAVAFRRICAHDGCTTILSRYNPLRFCALHAADSMTHEQYLRLAG